MNKIKLLFIHHCGTKSGAGNSLKTLIGHLDKANYDINIFCPDGSAFDEFLKISDSDSVFEIPELPEIVSISGYSSNYLRVAKAMLLYKNLKEVLSKAQKVNPDIIHLNEISLTPIAKLLKTAGFKVVIHARLVLDYKTKYLNKFVIVQANKYSDAVICIDKSVEHMLKGTNNTNVVYNSYQFSETNVSDYPKEKFIVLFLANLIKYKGVFDLLEAGRLLKHEADLEIHIAGGNSRPDIFFRTVKGKILNYLGLVKNNKSLLEQKILLYQLQNTVKLIGNISNIQDKISKSSINIFPSYMNGPSRSIFECGVLARPSIIALHDKISDVVENNVTGIIIDEGSPVQIAEAILSIKNNKELLLSMGRNAREKYLKLNDPVLNAKKVENIYKNLLIN
jgi:glycosyltransferase involved in cell wall biosynthesis